MFYELNIGLKASVHANDQADVTDREVLIALAAAGFKVRGYNRADSATEPTLIILASHLDQPGMTLQERVFYVSEALRQDAIAYRVVDSDKGFLAGPRAADWGTFNPEYFLPIGEEYYLQGAL